MSEQPSNQDNQPQHCGTDLQTIGAFIQSLMSSIPNQEHKDPPTTRFNSSHNNDNEEDDGDDGDDDSSTVEDDSEWSALFELLQAHDNVCRSFRLMVEKKYGLDE